jgi:hypothetical protein
MRKLSVLLALVAGLFISEAYADFTGKDAALATITFKNPGTCTAVVCVPVAQLYDGTNVVTLTTAGADAVSNSLVGVPTYSRTLIFNGTTWDRWQGAVTVAGVATAANQTTINTSIGTTNTNIGPPGATVCATDTGSCSLNALFQRALQTLTLINTNVQGSIPAGAALIGDVNLRQGGAALSATNGIYSNCLLGNAACATGTGAQGATSQRVAVATDTATVAGTAPAAAGLGATGSAAPSGAQYNGVLDAVGGTNMVGLAGDPCQTSVKTTVPFTLATAAVKVAITGVSAKKIYVCAYELTNNAADSVAIFEATTGTTCATSAVAVVGAGTSVATAATGFNFSANGGIARGNGAAQILQTATNANDLCVAQSAATQLTGSFTYVTR